MRIASTLPNVIHLEVGQPNFNTPKHIIDATIDSLNKNQTAYVPNDGIMRLKEIVAHNYTHKLGIKTDASNICITTGSMLGMYSLFLSLIDPNDEVLLPNPGFPNYLQSVMLSRGVSKPYICHPNNGYIPDINDISKLISSKTKAIVLCNPGNPTGAVMPNALIEEVIKLANERDVFVISDEIYSDIIFDRKKFTSAAAYDIESNRLATVSGVSKGYAMTGYRVGWIRSSKIIIDTITKLQEPIVSCGTSFSQYGAVAALEGSDETITEMVGAYQERRDKALAILKRRGRESKYIPGGAFYLPINITNKKGYKSNEFAIDLLHKKYIAIAPGLAFDNGASSLGSNSNMYNEHMEILDSFCRISLANSLDNVCIGIERICDHLDELDT